MIADDDDDDDEKEEEEDLLREEEEEDGGGGAPVTDEGMSATANEGRYAAIPPEQSLFVSSGGRFPRKPIAARHADEARPRPTPLLFFAVAVACRRLVCSAGDE